MNSVSSVCAELSVKIGGAAGMVGTQKVTGQPRFLSSTWTERLIFRFRCGSHARGLPAITPLAAE